MTPETLDLFRAVTTADAIALQRALAAGADVNATDDRGRNVTSHAALGDAIDAIDAPTQPRLSERRLDILQLVLQHQELSLYSLNAPLVWAGGVTLLGLMSWLNMSTEIMCLLELTQGLVEVNAMDEQGATPLMYAARDGSLQVVQRLIAYGARPDLKDTSQRSAIQYALPHPQIMWLCEDALRRERSREPESFSPGSSALDKKEAHRLITRSHHRKTDTPVNSLFFSTPTHRLLTPPPQAWFDGANLRRTFDALLRAIRNGDLETLHALLLPTPPSRDLHTLEQHSEVSPSTSTPLLVNLRDSAGLTLVHHAVSQWRSPSVAVLDALHQAGCDVGLFSTLGFTPLHHLARTARDDPKPAKREHGLSTPTLVMHTHPLYAFTAHLVRDLHAPLGATDSKGETPLHAAAEHGHSVSVLQAMLDYDGQFTGREAVREARNERGLRPVDVARPEFSPLFVHGHQVPPHSRSRSQSHLQSPGSLDPKNQVQRPPASGSTPAVRSPRAGVGLAKKGSSASMASKSSESSSTSSGAQSLGSHLSHQSHRSHKLATPIHILPTPDPTPPGSYVASLPLEQDPYASIDVSACALDVLSNLSLCATALQAYVEPRSNLNDGPLPDIPTLSDTLLFTRDLASHVLEHWTSRLELARDEFERARREVRKAEGLRERVGREVGKLLGIVENQEGGALVETTAKSDHTETGSPLPVLHAGVQTDSDDRDPFDDLHQPVPFPAWVDAFGLTDDSTVLATHLANMAKVDSETAARAVRVSVYARMEKEGLQELVTPQKDAALKGLMKERRAEEGRMREMEDERRVKRWYAESARQREEGLDKSPVLAEWVMASMKGEPLRLEIVREVEGRDGCMVGREARMPSWQFPAPKGITVEPRGQETPAPRWSETMDSPVNALQSAPRVLQRADRDLHGIVAQLALVNHSFTRAQQSIAQARMLVEQAIKSREDELNALIRMYHQQDFSPTSHRLPPILERSLEPMASSPQSMDQLSSSSSTFDFRYVAAGLHLEEPHLLRRLLTRKLSKYVECVFDDLQKAHVWLRIVREVLRGLRRRACVEH